MPATVVYSPFGTHPAGIGLPPFGVRRQPDTLGPQVISGDGLMAPVSRSAPIRRRFGLGAAKDQSAVAALRRGRRTADLGKQHGNNAPRLVPNQRQRAAGALQRVG